MLEDVHTYDAAGRRISKSTLGPTVRETPMAATYDAANRMTSLVLQPGTAQERRYALTQDAADQLIEKVRIDAQGQPTRRVLDMRSSYVKDLHGKLLEIGSHGSRSSVASGHR